MSIIISSGLVLSDVVSGGGIINANNPVVGWQTRITSGNVTATTAETGYPASNLANPSTELLWRGLVSSPAQDEYLTLALNTNEQVDYIGIAHHNFASAQIAVSVEVLDDQASPVQWNEVIAPHFLPNDGPAIYRFTPQGISSIRLRLQPGTAAPYLAVAYAGKLLVLQRRIYVGHTPINYARVSKITNARSESGRFLGRIMLNQMTKTGVELSNLTPDWYRLNMEPFIQRAYEYPFFFAWRPSDYPYEVGYAWLTSDPKPSNQHSNGLMQVSLELSGIYL